MSAYNFNSSGIKNLPSLSILVVIISENIDNLEKFLNVVDASAVFANTSTRFNDGFEFGLGAEVAVSTSKLHARGPMGLESITSYKWKVVGNGQIRI